MTHVEQAPSRRRSGAETRSAAQRAALRLFTEQGYERTSLRQIAEVLGINKASLYYHFTSKEAILRSLLAERGTEAEELATWVEQQPPSAALLEEAVLRWVDSFSVEKLQGIRFLRANPLVAQRLDDEAGDRVGVPLVRLAALLTGLLPHPTPEAAVLVRMALLSVNAAVEAAERSGTDDGDVVRAASVAARALVRRAVDGEP